jgi:hypothetical protein
MITRRASELECQAVIVQAAKRGGWRVHAERTSLSKSGRHMTAIQGDPGWPDLALCHPTRGTVFWELKRRGNKASEAQLQWLELLGGELVWVPEEVAARCEWLISDAA